MTPLWVDLELDWRGGQSQALLALRGLRARGHPAELVALRESPLARRAGAEGIPVHVVGRRAARLQAALLLSRLLAGRRFEVLHANEAHALTAAWLAGAHRRVQLVASRRVAYRLKKNPLARARYHSARRILAISEYVAGELRASGIPGEQVEVVHDGVEIPELPSPSQRRQARARWGVPDEGWLLGCVGHLLPTKGQHLLIRGLAALRAQAGGTLPNCRLLLVGDGPRRKHLEELARELRVESVVHFTGFIDDLSEVYRALDVFLFPSLLDGLGTALLAAMAHTLPVIAVARGGVPEIVEHEQNGLLVTAAEDTLFPEAIAVATSQLLEDETLRKRLGSAARATIEKRFTAELMAANTLRAYERMLSPGNK
ncbi:MAG TPA: glycosyltransferase family 4 protein [Candidatus Acidoferrales bacterium]|nr:glycosyltransferase family 4 protein [Candidatus Acidoferrales bacterium]